MNPILAFGTLPLAEAAETTASIQGLLVYLGVVIAIIFGAAAYAKKGLNQSVFRNVILSAFEQAYLFVEGMCVSTIGRHGRKYVPMILTFWLVIFVSNLLSLFAAFAPTADLSFNLALALTVILYVQWEGIKANGFFGHFRHFAGPKLGGPLVLISVMIFFIEIVSELMKNVSLSLRLYGNIHGGHAAVEAMNKLGVHILGPVSIPFGEFLMPIKMLTVVVQSLIFCLLTCVYLSLVTHHEEEHPEETHLESEFAPMAEHMSPV